MVFTGLTGFTQGEARMGFPVHSFLLCLRSLPEWTVSGLTPHLEYDFE